MGKYVFFLGSSILLNACSYVFYIFSSQRTSGSIVSIILLLVGLILGATNATLYTRSLIGIKLNTAYPVFSAASLILVTLISVFVFSEALNPVKVLGIVVISIGVVLTTIS